MIHFLPGVLADVAEPDVAGEVVHVAAPGIADAEGPDLVQVSARAIDKGVVRWNRAILVDANDFATGARHILRLIAVKFLAGGEIQFAVRTKLKPSAIVAAVRNLLVVLGVAVLYIACAKLGLEPAKTHDLPALRSVLSTGSPLAPEGFDYVYGRVKKDVQLASISGGTDIIACFALGNPIGPVWRGELQCRGLGMAGLFQGLVELLLPLFGTGMFA